MTIHSSHPFATPEPERDPVRRLRGRMPAPVSVWAAGKGAGRAGWTLSSFLVIEGEPAEVLGVLDEDSVLGERLVASESGARSSLAVNLLGWQHRGLADAFAGLAPAPGGPFTLGRWRDTDWGPVLDDTPGWLGVRLRSVPDRAGWSLLVRGSVEHVELGTESGEGILAYVRGRYRAVSLEVSRSL